MSYPRAVIHKRILETAKSRPDASLEEISNEVAGAKADLVDRVLEEYGDPATESLGAESLDEIDDQSKPGTKDVDGGLNPSPEPLDAKEDPEPLDAQNGLESLDAEDGVQDPDSESEAITELPPDRAGLTQKQYDTLCAIADHPEATQRDLAEHLGITPSTVNYRLNSIQGFKWANRCEFVPPPLSAEADQTDATTEIGIRQDDRDASTPVETSQTSRISKQIDALQERIDSLEQTLEAQERKTTEARTQEMMEVQDLRGIRADTALVRNILRSCMDAEFVTKDEELRIIEAFMVPDAAEE